MAGIAKRGPITSPVERDPKGPIRSPGFPENGFTRRPNPGKGKVPKPVPKPVPEPMTMPDEPSLPAGEERGGVLRPDDMVTRVGQAVTGQLVPTVTRIAQQNQKKGPKRRQPTTGTLGSSGSLL